MCYHVLRPLSCLCSVSHLFCSSPVPNDYPAYFKPHIPCRIVATVVLPCSVSCLCFFESNFACLYLLEGIVFCTVSLQKLCVFFGVEAYSGRVPCFCVCLFDPLFFVERSEEHTSELQSHLNLVCR